MSDARLNLLYSTVRVVLNNLGDMLSLNPYVCHNNINMNDRSRRTKQKDPRQLRTRTTLLVELYFCLVALTCHQARNVSQRYWTRRHVNERDTNGREEIWNTPLTWYCEYHWRLLNPTSVQVSHFLRNKAFEHIGGRVAFISFMFSIYGRQEHLCLPISCSPTCDSGGCPKIFSLHPKNFWTPWACYRSITVATSAWLTVLVSLLRYH